MHLFHQQVIYNENDIIKYFSNKTLNKIESFYKKCINPIENRIFF